MSEEREGEALERYRNAYLELRGALHDRTTDLPAYPLLAGTLRTWLDTRRHVGVVHVEAANLVLVESIYGWQVFDRILARMAAAMRACLGAELPADTRLAIDAVPAERLVAFVPSDHQGRDIDPVALSRFAADVKARLEETFDDEDFGSLSPQLAFRVGYAILSDNPFYRLERRIHGAVAEARSLEDRRELQRERVWRSELHRILRDRSISVLFQPVVELASRRILGYEALSRGPKDSALEMPRAMFALSDRVGAAVDLDRVCRSAALSASEAVAGWGKLFLNVHPACLGDPDWRGGVGNVLDASARSASDLVLELSERRLGDDVDQFSHACGELRREGFGIALDDVGTGYASLRTLEKVRPDFVKVDVSLVRGIDVDLIRQEAMVSIVRSATRVGASVVGVGVETEAEAEVLRDSGTAYGQGYLFAGPSPLGALLRSQTDNG